MRSILRAISPEGNPLSQLELQSAVETLNTRIRTSNLSAREIMFSRLQDSNQNIILNDDAISENIFESRQKSNNYANKKVEKESLYPPPKLHSLVFLKNDVSKDKTKVRDLYIVTNIDSLPKEITIQKLLHPLTDGKSDINNLKQYVVKSTDVYPAPSSKKQEVSQNKEHSSRKVKIATNFTPAKRFFTISESDSDDDSVQMYTSTVKTNKIPNKISPEEPKPSNISIWSPNFSEQLSMSPIFHDCLADPNFGDLTWDHSSDISTPLYETESDSLEDSHNIAMNLIDHVLNISNNSSESSQIDDEVFEIENENDFTLSLKGDTVQLGRVYRLNSRLSANIDLQIREQQPKIAIPTTVKRLKSTAKIDVKTGARKHKKKTYPIFNWFLRKITLSRDTFRDSWFVKKFTFNQHKPPD